MALASNLQLEAGGTVYELKDATARQMLAYFPADPNVKNGLARGKNIQTYFDNGKLFDRIADGSLDDLFIGDYWKASYNGVTKTFRIAGFNTLYNNGDTAFTKPHAVIVPDESLVDSKMNDSNTTTGGYVGSYMHTTTIGAIATASGTTNVNKNLYSIFGSHLLTTRELLTNAINANATAGNGMAWSGASNNWAWTDCQAVLMSEIELYGANVFSSSGYDTGNANMQLPLFRLMPKLKNPGRYWFWLRNVASSTHFCLCGDSGFSGYTDASNVYGVRPRFVIG